MAATKFDRNRKRSDCLQNNEPSLKGTHRHSEGEVGREVVEFAGSVVWSWWEECEIRRDKGDTSPRFVDIT